MEKINKLAKARDYVYSMAMGFHPVTKEVLPSDSVINDVKVVRCLYYVSEVLKETIADALVSENNSKMKKVPFYLTESELARFKISCGEITISAVVRQLNSLKENENMQKLTTKYFTLWLIDCGLLKRVEENGKNVSRPTREGERLGMSVKKVYAGYGIFDAVVYNRNAQQFLIDNFYSVLSYNKNLQK